MTLAFPVYPHPGAVEAGGGVKINVVIKLESEIKCNIFVLS